METPADGPATNKCPVCGTANPPGNWFCGRCGTAIDPVSAAVNAYVDARLKQQLDLAIKNRFGDREVTELSLAAAAAEKLSEWAKLLGYAVGIPLTLAALYLTYLGWDAKKVVTSTKDQVQAAKDQAQASQIEAAKVAIQIRQVEADANAVRGQIPPLQELIAQSTTQLKSLPALTRKIDKVADDVADIRAGVGAPVFRQAVSEGRALGIDVSHYDVDIDWVKLKKSGVSFVYIKATQGVSNVDPRFVENVKKARAAGILTGAYHFLKGSDVARQADSFLAVVRGINLDLPPEIDFEPGPAGPSATVDDLAKFASLVKDGTGGCTPVIYGVASNLKTVQAETTASGLQRYPLAIAQYVPVPTVPMPWKEWSFWQFSNGLSVNGMPGTDFLTFNGSVEQLRGFARTSCSKH